MATVNDLLQQAMSADAAVAAKHQAEVETLINGLNAIELSYAHSTNVWQATKADLMAEIELLKARPMTLPPKAPKVPKAAKVPKGRKGKGELDPEQVSNELQFMSKLYQRKWAACKREWKVLMSKGLTKDEAKAQVPFTPTKDERAGEAAVRKHNLRAQKQRKAAGSV